MSVEATENSVKGIFRRITRIEFRQEPTDIFAIFYPLALISVEGS
jgi:hypothetical protein